MGNLVRSAFVAASVAGAGSLLVAKANVVWHDPWCTPRWTPYFILFWGVRDTLGQLLLLLALCGVTGLVVAPSSRRHWGVWAGVLLCLVALYHAVTT